MNPADDMFPLTLSDFEHYAFRDDSADHPMVIVLRTSFEGQLNESAFRQALDITLLDNPLLRAVVDESGWRSEWRLLKNHKPTLTAISYDSEAPPLHCPLQRIDLRNEAGVTFQLRLCADRGVLITHFHHACVDGIGAIRFIGDVFAHYGQLTASSADERPRVRRPNPQRLLSRGTKAMAGDQRKPRAPIGHTLLETCRLFLRKSYCLVRCGESSAPPGKQETNNIIATRVLPRSVLKQLRELAASNGATVNDLCMMVFLQKTAMWSSNSPGAKRRDLFRILMPVSMRTPDHDDISAANVVSYVFHSFRRHEILSSESLLEAIRNKSQQMLNRNEAAAMLHGFALTRWIPGLFRLSQIAQPNFATAVMTNVGEVRRIFENRFPLIHGRAIAGNVVIQRIDGVAPVRSNTNMTMAFGTYGGELIMHLNRNTHLFSSADADELLQNISDGLSALAGSNDSRRTIETVAVGPHSIAQGTR
ncbi:hypothetical protein [Fuerstiella marisgermanici]|uniref:Acyltransferase n=1 Tax=Fuerstiella marisgermanici TaxID=1891926 RepID=A0A1P8WNG4_9PLAN|nr:hypothetical protein [Fuerstiella marisgermanici]APZ95602.1 acyltransferase [Fuerstiella marisgermanici]